MQSEAKAKQAADGFFRDGPVISPLSTYDAFIAGFTAALSDQERAVEVKPFGCQRANHPAGCVEEFYEGDEVAYLRDKLKQANERCRVHQACVTSVDILREWFGAERYARDYEYLDENFGKQAENVVSYIRSALVDVPVEPVAWIDDGTIRAGSDKTAHRVVTDAQKRDMPTSVAASFTIPLYASPHREGEDSAEVLRSALQRISELTPARANAKDARDLHHTVKAIADVALAATRSASATSAKGCADE